MTQSISAMSQAEDEPPLVEDVWEDVLVEFGFERDRAAQITRSVFAKPDLTLTERPPDEMRRIVDEELRSLDFESEIGSRSKKLRMLLMEFLDAGLDGVLLGPSTAPDDLKYEATDSPGEAFDAIRQGFSKANVSPETIDLTAFPSAGGGATELDEQTSVSTPDTPDSLDSLQQHLSTAKMTSSEPFTTGRSFAQDIEEEGRYGDGSSSEVESILQFIDDAMNDESPIVREQVVRSLASLATVPGVRADRQIDKLLDAYHDEPDPEVRAAIVEGLGKYVREIQESRTIGDDDSGDDDSSTDDDRTDPDVDPRDATTGKFSDSGGA